MQPSYITGDERYVEIIQISRLTLNVAAIPDMSKDLQVFPSVVNLSVAIYLVASSIFPLWWASLSEMVGRRLVLILSFLLNIPLTFACGMNPNVVFLIALRLLSGSACASGQTVAASVIADVW